MWQEIDLLGRYQSQWRGRKSVSQKERLEKKTKGKTGLISTENRSLQARKFVMGRNLTSVPIITLPSGKEGKRRARRPE